MAMTLGGRAAEEIVFGEITTGASNDIEKVTATAKAMVMRYGMSERLGPRVFGHDHSQPFLGREFSSEPDYSDEIAREIDDEIRRVVESAHQRAKRHPHRASRDAEHGLGDPRPPRDDREGRVRGAASTAQPEEDVFPEEVAAPQLPPPAAPADKPGRDAPRTLPRPGLAGGARGSRGRAAQARAVALARRRHAASAGAMASIA